MFTKGKIPFLPPKCPIQHKILNISLIFFENLLGMGEGKFFPNPHGPPCALYMDQRGSIWLWKIFPPHCSLYFFSIHKGDFQEFVEKLKNCEAKRQISS